jgi:hypothetical protein
MRGQVRGPGALPLGGRPAPFCGGARVAGADSRAMAPIRALLALLLAAVAAADDRVTPRVLAPAVGGLAAAEARRGATLVAAHAGPCADALDALNEVVADWGKLLHACSVDVSADKASAAALNISPASLPSCTLRIVGAPAGDRGDPDEWPAFAGNVSDGKALQRWAFSLFPEAAATVASAAALGALAAHPATGAPRPVALLVSPHDSTPPLMHALAWHVRGVGYGVGAVPTTLADADLLAQLRVPTTKSTLLLAFVPPPDVAAKLAKEQGAPKGGGMAVQPFAGPLKFVVLDAWLRLAAPKVGLGDAGDDAASTTRSLADPTAAPVAIPRVGGQAALEALCPPSSRTLCVLAPLNPATPAGTAALDGLSEAAGAWGAQPVAFGWVGAAAGAALAAALGSDEAPTALVFSPAKARGIALEGPLTGEALSRLLDGVFSGAARAAPLVRAPRLDGKRGAEPKADDDEDGAAGDDGSDLDDVLAGGARRKAGGGRDEL